MLNIVKGNSQIRGQEKQQFQFLQKHHIQIRLIKEEIMTLDLSLVSTDKIYECRGSLITLKRRMLSWKDEERKYYGGEKRIG